MIMSIGSLPGIAGSGLSEPVIRPSLTPRTVESTRAAPARDGIADQASAESACFVNSRRENILLHLSFNKNFARSASPGLQL